MGIQYKAKCDGPRCTELIVTIEVSDTGVHEIPNDWCVVIPAGRPVSEHRDHDKLLCAPCFIEIFGDHPDAG